MPDRVRARNRRPNKGSPQIATAPATVERNSFVARRSATGRRAVAERRATVADPRRYSEAKPATKLVPEPFRFPVLFPPDSDDLAGLVEPHAEQDLLLDPDNVLAAVFEIPFEIRP